MRKTKFSRNVRDGLEGAEPRTQVRVAVSQAEGTEENAGPRTDQSEDQHRQRRHFHKANLLQYFSK